LKICVSPHFENQTFREKLCKTNCSFANRMHINKEWFLCSMQEKGIIPHSKILRALLPFARNWQGNLQNFKKNEIQENHSLGLERKDRERAFVKGFY
jgi:hypothetical protein